MQCRLSSGLCRRHQRWAKSILRKLIAYRDGRNAALMRAAFDFRSIIADRLIAEADARSLLVMACSEVAQDHGIGRQFEPGQKFDVLA
jgi:hypothetical protein